MADLGAGPTPVVHLGVSAIDVAIVGAGWSGLACALACSDAGARVTLIDAAPQPGGRARRVDVTLGDRDYALDNGQHMLVGAYRATERLMRRVGIDPARVLHRLPLAMIYPDGFRFVAADLPAPFHLAAGLITARGLTVRDRIALARLMQAWRRARWTAPADAAAASILATVSRTLVDRLFEPLCLAALNLRLADASARMFLAVLKDSVGASRRASEFWIACVDLSALAPDAALAALASAGADVRLRTLATGLTQIGSRWQLQTRTGSIECGAVVLALPPDRARPLLQSAGARKLDEAIGELARIESAPIATVYLRFPAGTRLPHPVLALMDAPARDHFGQWVFDRGALDDRNDGVLAVVISGRGPHIALPHDALARRVAEQLGAALSLPPPLASAVLVERRATVLATPALRRPPARLPCRGLYLAGDAADSAYPSTIEGSVRAGLAAAAAWSEDRAAPAAASALD